MQEAQVQRELWYNFSQKLCVCFSEANLFAVTRLTMHWPAKVKSLPTPTYWKIQLLIILKQAWTGWDNTYKL